MRYAILLIRIDGAILFFSHLKGQIFHRYAFLSLQKNLDTKSLPIPCEVRYSLQLASDKDMQEMIEMARAEGKESAYELIGRKLFYDSGFRDCYVARSADTNELCFIQWMISPQVCQGLYRDFGNMLPRLESTDLWMENSYTFKKYRGKKLYPAVLVDLAHIARDKGFKRILTYVREDNIASIKGCERAGFQVFGRGTEVKFLFSTRRKYQ
jgi:GNAT superfamily N-acetyltransferase